jgi:hypothetical protein
MRSLKYIIVLLTLLIAVQALALDPGTIYLRRATLDATETGKPSPVDLLARSGDEHWLSEADGDGTRLWIVHFPASPGQREIALIQEAGARVLGYLPARAYLIEGDTESVALLSAGTGVDMLAEYRPAWKLSPNLVNRSGRLDLTLSFPRGADLVSLTDRLRDMGAELRDSQLVPDRARLHISTDADLLDDLSRLPGLIWLAESEVFTDRNDDIKWISQSGIYGVGGDPNWEPIWDAGLHGEGQILGHIDSGFDYNRCWFEDPGGNPVGPDHRKVVYIDPDTINGRHGTHTAGTLAGYGYIAVGEDTVTLKALSYMARMTHSKYLTSSYDLYSDLETHYQAGACIHTNSWGASGSADTLYTATCRDIDRFSHDHEDNMVAFAIMNGTPAGYLLSPENAKNVLAVGASKAGPYFDEHSSGRGGPTPDGRRKPEIFAPGLGINSAYYIGDCTQYSMSGTSMACPAVSSGAGLVRQYFIDGWYPTGSPVAEHSVVPSGALMRAVLINATLPMIPTYTTDLYPGYPNDAEGWGRLTLDQSLFLIDHHYLGVDIVDSLRLRVVDIRNAHGLGTDEWNEIQVEIESAETPLRITMAFTDFPGLELAEYPVVNDLNLIVTSPSGAVYLGNDFDTVAGQSTDGSVADEVNMVERVIRHAPEVGVWTVRVTGNHIPRGPQGYALAINGYLADPPLEMVADFDVTGNGDESQLTLQITPSLPLLAPSLTLEINGDPVDAGGIEGGIWLATLPLTGTPDSLHISACATSELGTVGCLETDLFLTTVTGSATTVASPDGSFRLRLEDGNGLDTRVLVYEVAVAVGGRDTDLKTWCLRPEGLELFAPGKGVVEFDFPSGIPTEWWTPEDLIITGNGETLSSYYDLDRGVISAGITELGCFTLVGGNEQGGLAVNSAFKRLDHNFPNPFKTGTTISFELRQAQNVTLRIYDVAGRETAVLLDGEQLFVGPHEFYWNGRDSDGTEMSSGIYLARLETELAGTSSIRIVLVR